MKFQKVIVAIGSLLVSSASLIYAQEWLWELQPAQYEDAGVVATKIDGEGSLILCGSIRAPMLIGAETFNPQGDSGVFLAKLDSTGAVVWFYMVPGPGSLGLSDCDVYSDGSVVAVGSFAGTLVVGRDTLFTDGSYDVLVLSLDADGKLLWARSESSPGSERGEFVAVNDADMCVVSGRYYDSVTVIGGDTLVKQQPKDLLNSFVVCYDGNGAPKWSANIESPVADVAGPLVARGGDRVVAVFRVGPGARIIGKDVHGMDEEGITVVEFRPDGSFRELAFFSHDNAFMILGAAVDSLGRLYFAGRLGDTAEIGGRQIGKAGIYTGYIIRMTEGDVVDWVFETWGNEIIQIFDVAVDQRGNVYFAPYYRQEIVIAGDTVRAVGGFDHAIVIVEPHSMDVFVDTVKNSSRHDVILNVSQSDPLIYVGGQWGSGYLAALQVPERFLRLTTGVLSGGQRRCQQYLRAEGSHAVVFGMTDAEIKCLRIVDLLGRTVSEGDGLSIIRSRAGREPRHEIDFSTFSDGAYFLISTESTFTAGPLVVQGGNLWMPQDCGFADWKR